METFITLTKYNTCQRREESNPLLVVYYLVSILGYLSHVLLFGRVQHKAFLRWVRAQSHSQNTPIGSKKASSLVGIALKKVPQAPNDKHSPSEEGQSKGRRLPKAKGVQPWDMNARLPRAPRSSSIDGNSQHITRYLSLPPTRQDLTQSR